MSEPDPPGRGAPPLAGAEHGAIDVAMSDAHLPRVTAPADPGHSGSVDVRISEPELRPVDLHDPSASGRRRAATLPALGAKVVHAAEEVGEKVAHAADVIGGTVARAGERVGESLSHLPVMPKTRRGRVMARSVLVSFVLVFGWIAVIVGLQLRVSRPPDLRPDAEAILVALRDGKAAQVYADASVELQRVMRDPETFVDQMDDMGRTLGRFLEITAVVATETNRGPGGRTGRIDLRLEYEQGKTEGSLSFRRERGRWKLLGLAIEVPEAIRAKASSKQEQIKRSEVRPDELAELKTALEGVLSRWGKGEIAALWRDASPIFQQALSVEDLERAEGERRRSLGGFDRILDIHKVRLTPRRNKAHLVVLLQFEHKTITGNFDFDRIDGVWRLELYQLLLPVLAVDGG